MSDKYVNVNQIAKMRSDYTNEKNRLEQEINSTRNKLTDLTSTLSAYTGAISALDALKTLGSDIIPAEPNNDTTT